MRPVVLALALLASPVLAQTPEPRPPVDVRMEFEKLVSQIEQLLDRSLEPEMRDQLRARLAPLVSRLEAGSDDDAASETFRLERRLARLRENRRGTFDNIPPALFEAYQRVLDDEERRLVEALRARGKAVD
ncbi:MAG: hypothetical protein HY059_24045 [Proteobacteria bacterium]|nr:hypothetical protein [Pseudomonadota bacterium]